MTVPAIKRYAPTDMTDLNKIINLGDPTDAQDAATKSYVDLAVILGPDWCRLPTTVFTGFIWDHAGDPYNIGDGSDTTYWSASENADIWVKADFGRPLPVASFRFLGSLNENSWVLQSSPNNSTWTTRYTYSKPGTYPDTGRVTLSVTTSARYWRWNPTATAAWYVRVNTLALFGPNVHAIAWLEAPGGAIDGSNPTFTLGAIPTDLPMIFKNGILQREGSGNDFTRSGLTITFEAGNLPQTDDILLCTYQW